MRTWLARGVVMQLPQGRQMAGQIKVLISEYQMLKCHLHHQDNLLVSSSRIQFQDQILVHLKEFLVHLQGFIHYLII